MFLVINVLNVMKLFIQVMFLKKINRIVETLKQQMTEIAVADYEMAA